MADWNFPAHWDAIAAEIPGATAIVAGERRVSWGAFVDRATRLAWSIQHDDALAPGDRIAIALPNRPEYLEAYSATLRLRCVPVGVDHRRPAHEIRAAVDGSDAKLVVHDAATSGEIRAALRGIGKRWRPRTLATGDDYESAIAGADPPPGWPGDQVTGQDPLPARPGTALPAAPLLHPRGLGCAVSALNARSTVVLLPRDDFDATAVWDAVAREGVETLAILGDPFARRLVQAVRAEPDRWDLSSLRVITSSGGAIDPATRQALLDAIDGLTVVDRGEDVSRAADERVETDLRKHPSIRDCAIVRVPTRTGEMPVALVTVADDHHLDEPELAAWCRARLPGNRAPRRFAFVADLARTGAAHADQERFRDLASELLSPGRDPGE